MLIEASRRASRIAVERVRSALIEYDRVVFKDVQYDVPAERAFSVVRDGRTYVLAFEDPSVEPLGTFRSSYDSNDPAHNTQHPDRAAYLDGLERDCGY